MQNYVGHLFTQLLSIQIAGESPTVVISRVVNRPVHRGGLTEPPIFVVSN